MGHFLFCTVQSSPPPPSPFSMILLRYVGENERSGEWSSGAVNVQLPRRAGRFLDGIDFQKQSRDARLVGPLIRTVFFLLDVKIASVFVVSLRERTCWRVEG